MQTKLPRCRQRGFRSAAFYLTPLRGANCWPSKGGADSAPPRITFASKEAHAWHQAARVHHDPRRRGSGLAALRARAAAPPAQCQERTCPGTGPQWAILKTRERIYSGRGLDDRVSFRSLAGAPLKLPFALQREPTSILSLQFDDATQPCHLVGRGAFAMGSSHRNLPICAVMSALLLGCGAASAQPSPFQARVEELA